MIKYELHNIVEGRVSTAQVGGKRIVLSFDEKKVISFTNYKKFEKSLISLKNAHRITCDKLMGEKAKSAEISKSLVPDSSEDAKQAEIKRLEDEATEIKKKEEAETKRLEDEATETKRLEEEAKKKAEANTKRLKDSNDSNTTKAENSNDQGGRIRTRNN